jgi:propionyl-CoA carboxylase alpha chain/3-methylcrotonyl-CoA carboxylase alpha subunit/acetyl-CoA/propionyl-CoA carboxylase biotin carboxyl carrier protein
MKDIKKVLIPNRGEIACRILRTLDSMNIPGVIVYHTVDANTPAVKMADEKVEIQGTTPVSAYLDVEQIINACKKTGADAVHPGFGFLAENADFARRIEQEEIIFIGPRPKVIEMMGNKVAARTFCIENNFPLTPSVTQTAQDADFIKSVKQIGLPVLIKAAAGGGGKGMQIVNEWKDLEAAVQLAREEAKRSFGNSEVYAEQYVEKSRHIEVQVLADHHGNIIHLGERECSIQRRFQKIIEESPAPSLAPELRKAICDTAVEITRKAGYRNAGTVEFILAPGDKFYFLEMNTRLQVEHPVTEMVTGVDLVKLQICVARGEQLPLIQEQVQINGHAIEMRLYAEDPENDFLPATGQLLVYQMPSDKKIRVENGFTEGMTVSSAFDPMLAKLIVHGKDRNAALEQGVKALKDTLILGVTTNTDYLARILSHPIFLAGKAHTGFIPQYAGDLKSPALNKEERNMLLAATALNSREFVDPAFKVPEPHCFFGNWRN